MPKSDPTPTHTVDLAELARELELIRCRVAMCIAALEVENTSVSIDAANVLQRDVDDALVPIVEQLEHASGTSPLQLHAPSSEVL